MAAKGCFMSAMRRAAILKLASAAYEMNLGVLNGVLHQEKGRWQIGSHDLLDWLARHEGEELVIILGRLQDEHPLATRTCGTCGRDYSDLECPYCRANRIRLRGRA